MKSDYRLIPHRKAAATESPRFALKALAVSLIVAFGSNVYALPVGGVVAAGGASISSVAGSTTITQSSQNVAINWQSFNIGVGEAVRFIQPSSSSVALNRVLGPDPSSILGSMSANGKVFLVNPNGILFGKGAQINVGGLIASTLNITDGDFMAGKFQFAGTSDASILNQGSINADGGYVALLGASVSNEGIIVAKLGTVTLAAGNAITLDVAGDGLLNITVSQGAVNALVQNGGLIQADGGQVLLTASAAGTLLQSAVNNTGVIQAQTIENHNGIIRLLGDMQSGTMNISGTLDVSGAGAGQTGGSITVTGHHVGLFGANINASGDAGGGIVLIGGDYQGKNPAVQNAAATYMSPDSTITADAISNGNGGKVILWSDESTRAYGTITARGGAQGGNGGLIETSGHWLDTAGIMIDASAQNGKAGTWLLDPADITINLGPTASMPVGPTAIYAPDSSANTSILSVANLVAALGVGGGTDVTITTTNTGIQGVPPSGLGDITIASALTWSPGGTATLTLNAAGDVYINAAVTTTRGSLVVCCGRDINVNALITTTGLAATPNTGGNVLLSAGRDVNIVRAAATGLLPEKNLTGITTTNGNILICAGNDINLTNTFNAATLITLTDSVAASAPPTGPVTPRGMTLIAGAAATGPGVAGGGTLKMTGGVNLITVTGPGVISPINITYNPTSYTAPTNYSGFFTGTGGPVNQFMLVFPGGANKAYDQTTTAVFTSFQPDINGLVPGGGAMTLAGGSANFDTAALGNNKPITYSGFTLGGASAGFALPTACCGVVTRTTGNITGAPLTLTADDATKVYGQIFTPLSTAFMITPPVGLLPGETVTTVAETSVAGTPAGATVALSPYPIIITPGSALGAGGFNQANYIITYVPGALTVTPAPLTITANPQTKVFGAPDPTLTYITGPFQAADTAAILSGALVRVAGETVVASPYAINQGTLAANTNYTIAYTPANLVITPIVPAIPPVAPGGSTGTTTSIAPEEMVGAELAPETTMAWLPTVVRTSTPPQLLAFAPTVPPPILAAEEPIVVPAEAPPRIFVPPVRLPKQDRN